MALNKLPQSYSIQSLKPADLDAVMEIERLSFKSPWSRQVFAEELSRTWAHVDVVRKSATGGIVAFCNYWLVADEVHLLNVATHPQERRLGHASRLLAHVLEYARRAACRLVTLEVRRSNETAQRLYRRFAFKAVGVRPNYYVDDQEDAVIMSLDTPLGAIMSTAAIALAILLSQSGAHPAVPPVAIGRVDTKEPLVALTFDACATLDQPNAFDREVFDIIKREQIPATVFVSGRWIEFHPDQARELAANLTIEFGNHSYSHPTLTTVDNPRLVDEIGRTEDLISQLGRHSVAFRPPAGVWSARTLKAAANRRLPTVLWDVVSGDVGGRLPPARMVEDVTRSVRPGSIVIFHINGRGPYTKDALPEIIKNLRQRGLRFVPLSQLLALPGARALPARPSVPKPKEALKDAGKAG